MEFFIEDLYVTPFPSRGDKENFARHLSQDVSKGVSVIPKKTTSGISCSFTVPHLCFPGKLYWNRLRTSNGQLVLARKEAEDRLLRDTLTGLLNRRAFEPLEEHELQRRIRFGSASSPLLADIDHFKKVNDSYGYGLLPL